MAANSAAGPGPRRNPVIDAALAQVSVRPARLDRPLRGVALDPTYSDPHLEELVRVATERVGTQAKAEGYAAGWSQGRQAAAERSQAETDALTARATAERAVVAQQVAELLSVLAEASRGARVATVPEWVEVADVLAEGALQLATAALGRELQSIDGAVTQAVKAALRHLAEPGEAVIHLNPTDAALVADDATLGVRVIADPSVAVGNVIALTPAQRLRHDLPAALAAAEEVLRS
jgi:flagellar assembly protein FliH